MNISIEIVPRDEDTVHAELAVIRESLPQVNMINIPDILRFKVRSWAACAVAKAHYPLATQHIRVVDFDLHKLL